MGAPCVLASRHVPRAIHRDHLPVSHPGVRLLLLGGPKFLGRAVIDAALEGGHDVTLFNRGTTGADLYPDVPRILGDRDGGLDGLRGGSGTRWSTRRATSPASSARAPSC